VTTDSATRACIFCNGQLHAPALAKQVISDCDLLIAADGGARHFDAIGLAPQVIIGDMDSIDSDRWKRNSGIEHIQYPTDKDKSDTELAVEYALGRDCEQVMLVAATGGRLDHTLGNIALVVSYPGRVAILDGTATLIAVDKSEKCVLQGCIGTLVSLMPYPGSQPTVRTAGLKYSLQNACLSAATQGLSNALSQTKACVCVSEGILLIYIENQGTSYSMSSTENSKRKQ